MKHSLNIQDWDDQYFVNIDEQIDSIKKSYKKLKKYWDRGEYVKFSKDPEHNTAYLMSYFYELIDRFTRDDSDENYRNIKEKFNRVIENYKYDHGRLIEYAIKWLSDMAYIKGDFEFARENANRYLRNREYWRHKNMTLEMYLTLSRLSEDAYIPPKYFIEFFNYRPYLLEYGANYEDEVEELIQDVLNDIYERQHINFVYYLNDAQVRGRDYFIGYLHQYSPSQYCDNKTYLQISGDHVMEGPTFDILLTKKSDYAERMRGIVQRAENKLREQHGVALVGEGWLSESVLFRQIEKIFEGEKVVQHASPEFLNRQHYDIYFPDHKIAIEYHGLQHFEPVDFFGGEEAFIANQERDQRKIKLSKENDVKLFIVEEGYNLKKLAQDINNIIHPHGNKSLKIDMGEIDSLREELQQKQKNYKTKMVELRENIKMTNAKRSQFQKIIKNMETNEGFVNKSMYIKFICQNPKYFNLSIDEVDEIYREFKEDLNREVITDGQLRRLEDDILKIAYETYHAIARYYETQKAYEKTYDVVRSDMEFFESLDYSDNIILYNTSDNSNPRYFRGFQKNRHEIGKRELTFLQYVNYEEYENRLFTEQSSIIHRIREASSLSRQKDVEEMEFREYQWMIFDYLEKLFYLERDHFHNLKLSEEDLSLRWKYLMDLLKDMPDESGRQKIDQYTQQFSRVLERNTSTYDEGRSHQLTFMRSWYYRYLDYYGILASDLLIFLNKIKYYELGYKIAKDAVDNNFNSPKGKTLKSRLEDFSRHVK